MHKEPPDPGEWRKARESYDKGSTTPTTQSTWGNKIGERIYDSSEGIVSVIWSIFKWAFFLFLALLVIAVILWILIGIFGLLKFGWSQL
jgi:hypothetical protein